jgi:hypothetical protein
MYFGLRDTFVRILGMASRRRRIRDYTPLETEQERARERDGEREGNLLTPTPLFPRLSCCVNAYGDIIVETRPPTGKKFIEFS